jgi:hypothetical protein
VGTGAGTRAATPKGQGRGRPAGELAGDRPGYSPTNTKGAAAAANPNSPCFARDAGFRSALAKSAFERILVWLGFWLISRESHSKSPAKQALSDVYLAFYFSMI